MESMRCEVLSGGIIFKGGEAANVPGIMVWFSLKLKKLIYRARDFFLSGYPYLPCMVGSVILTIHRWPKKTNFSKAVFATGSLTKPDTNA
jgi:hypothetical protein